MGIEVQMANAVPEASDGHNRAIDSVHHLGERVLVRVDHAVEVYAEDSMPDGPSVWCSQPRPVVPALVKRPHKPPKQWAIVRIAAATGLSPAKRAAAPRPIRLLLPVKQIGTPSSRRLVVTVRSSAPEGREPTALGRRRRSVDWRTCRDGRSRGGARGRS